MPGIEAQAIHRPLWFKSGLLSLTSTRLLMEGRSKSRPLWRTIHYTPPQSAALAAFCGLFDGMVRRISSNEVGI